MVNAGEARLDVVQTGNIRTRIAVQGSGPLVLLCHGFPESWRSWKSQLSALAAAGYRAVAPDMRGYGGTDAPLEIESYTMLHFVGDMVELVKVLGEKEAVIVGHDWGAPVAWNAAMLRPDLFRAVLEKQGVQTFYMQYFQKPGVAEAELEADVEISLRRMYFTMSGDGPNRIVAGILTPDTGILANTVEPERLPDWLDETDLAYVAAEFKRTGFRGGLNWYRNIKRSSELLAPWRGCVIRQPSLFIAGARDDVLRFPGMEARIKQLSAVLPGIRGCHILEGAGHWIQRERVSAVNELLLEFLRSL
jgi:pimeloyl-ACP methyl ester carboxylesterase